MTQNYMIAPFQVGREIVDFTVIVEEAGDSKAEFRLWTSDDDTPEVPGSAEVLVVEYEVDRELDYDSLEVDESVLAMEAAIEKSSGEKTYFSGSPHDYEFTDLVYRWQTES